MQVDQVAVTVSPQHFKALCQSLNETLMAYESAFGELKIPESDTRPLRDASQIEKLITAARERMAVLRDEPITSSSTEKKRPSRRSRGAAPK
jgi:hypothetical protein